MGNQASGIVLAFLAGGAYAAGAGLVIERWRVRTVALVCTAATILLSTGIWASLGPERQPYDVSRLMSWVGGTLSSAALFLMPAVVVLNVMATLRRTRIDPMRRWFLGAVAGMVSLGVGVTVALYVSLLIFHDGP